MTDELLLGGERLERRAGAGWAVLRALLHLSLLFVPWFLLRTGGRFLVGWKRRAMVRLGEDGLHLRRETMLLGRVVGQSETFFPLRSVAAVGRGRRYRWMHMLVGLLCLVVGGMVGVVAIHDGVAGGYAPLALAGFGLIGLGLAIDLGLHVLVPTARRRSVVELRLPREDVWIAEVEDDLAETFVRTLQRRLARPPRSLGTDPVPPSPAEGPPTAADVS